MKIPIITWIEVGHSKKEKRTSEIPITYKYSHEEIKKRIFDSMKQAVADNNKLNQSVHGRKIYNKRRLIIRLSYEDSKKSIIMVGIPNKGEKRLLFDNTGEITNGKRIFMVAIWRETADSYATINFFATSPRFEQRDTADSHKEVEAAVGIIIKTINAYQPEVT